jgi:mRNA interferase MazF
MKVRPIKIGDILLVELPQHRPPGHEQQGLRPAIVVGLPNKLGVPRYPTILVVPLTTQIGNWAERSPNLYPRLPAGTAGLTRQSVVLLDHLRAIDLRRIRRFIGSLQGEVFNPIRENLLCML